MCGLAHIQFTPAWYPPQHLRSHLRGFPLACRLVKYMFVEAGGLQSTAHCQDEAPWAPALLGRTCPLFARKFPENTTAEVRQIRPICSMTIYLWL